MNKHSAFIVLYILIVIVAISLATSYYLSNLNEEARIRAKIQQEQGLQTFWELVHAKGGDFHVDGDRMLLGDVVLNGNFELPDTVSRIFGGTATIFMGNTRISTNVRREDGSRAVGTRLEGPAFEAVFRQGRPYRGEAMILGVPYFTAYDPIRNEAGNVIGALYVGVRQRDFLTHYEQTRRDVAVSAMIIALVFAALAYALLATRRCYEDILAESEEKYRALFAGSAEGIFLLGDAFIDCNKQACRLLGCGREEIIGRSPVDFSPPLQPDGQASADRIQDILTTHTQEEASYFSWQHRRKDGTLIETEVSLKAVAFQKHRLNLMTVRDVTERRKMEEKYRAVFETTGTATVIIEDDTILSLVNDEFVRLSGFSREELEGRRSWTEFVTDQCREWMLGYHHGRRIDAHAVPSSYEFDFVDRFGVVRHILTSVKVIPGTGKSVMSCQDITDQKRTEKLLALENQIMELIAGGAPLMHILERICLAVEGQTDGGLCSILLADPDGERLRHGAAPSLPEEYNRVIDGTRIGPAIGSCGAAAHERRQVIAADIATDPGWAKYRLLPLSHGLRACWSTPIIAGTGELLGTFAVYYRSARAPGEPELHRIERATNLTSVAIMRTRGREALEATLRFRKILIDTIPNPVFFKDAKGLYIGCNRAFESAFGVTAADLAGKTVHEVAPAGLADLHARMDEDLKANGGLQKYEAPVLFADGLERQMVFYKAAFPGDDGTAGGIIGVMLDVTEIRDAEQAIRTLQRQQQAILDNIPDLVWLKDTESRFVAVNEAFARACGSTCRELVGKTDLDVWPRDLADHYRQDDRLVMALRQQRRIEEPLEETSGKRHWLETIKMPVIEENGAVVGTTGIARNIDARKQAEEALRESEERFRELFEQNEDAIILLRRESFDVIDANPAAEILFGHSRSELIRLGPWSFIAPEDYNTFIAAVPPPGEPAAFHMDRLGNVRKNGEAIIVSIWGKTIRLRNEEVVYCSIRDITDRIRMEEDARNTQARLIHANKMTSLGVLVSGIAHEINNPNTFIQGNAGIMEKVWQDVMPILTRHRESSGGASLGGLPFEEMERIVPRLLFGIREGARRISAIVGNLKDFARDDTAFGHSAIDVNNIIRDAALILTHHIHRHTDHFQLVLDDNLPKALGRAQQVEQVVINLIMNGLQSLPGKDAGLRVSTKADRAASAVVITVRDEGEGMAEEVMARLTEPFFSTRLERGGTGLGLSICATIIKEHNGSLQFESEPGGGTTVTVTLPEASGNGRMAGLPLREFHA